ncbi:MAG: vanadium-dependent haloperoxidase [Geminicoccales bacterium]
MRKTDAQRHRETAAQIAHDRQHPVHVANGEERAYRDSKSFMSFTKGLPHDPATGLVKDDLDPVRLRTAIDSGYAQEFDLNVPLGDRDPADDDKLKWRHFNMVDPTSKRIDLAIEPDGNQHRRWEAPTAGFVYDLEGPDCQAVTMPPAPPIVVENVPLHDHEHDHKKPTHTIVANPELVAEMAEVYWLAWLRDVPFEAFDEKSVSDRTTVGSKVNKAVKHLRELDFYKENGPHHPRRRFAKKDEKLSRQNIFRGHTPGDRKGPYLSQFMLMGSEHLGKRYNTANGFLQYGSITIDMRVRTATPERDYMTRWNEWIDVQNGANVRDLTQEYVGPPAAGDPDQQFRFITTPRDLATYVHFDALYEAYLNACLWLLNVGAPVDPNFRHLLAKTRHTEGFALFGGPQILSLMTEVATRGLKAVRFQKFNSHMRLRPEALAGLIAARSENALPSGDANDHVGLLWEKLDTTLGGSNLIDLIKTLVQQQNQARPTSYTAPQPDIAGIDNLPLLPMAFPEGSPMHPAYGAGHATVAGACVTILKAFFDEDACLARVNRPAGDGAVNVVTASEITSSGGGYSPVAFVPDSVGASLDDKGNMFGFLRLGDELNKLAANISIGRNMAGVHYYSDYIDSLRMGEEIAIGILQEQSIMYPKDPFNVSLTTFDGHRVVIGNGEIQVVEKPKHHGDGHHAEPLVANLPYQQPMAAS